MAIALVGAETAVDDTTAVNVGVTKPAGTTSADVVLAVAAVDDTDAIGLPSGFTVIHDQAFFTDTRFKVGYKAAGGSEPATYTFTKADNQTGAFGVIVFRGVNNTTTIDVSPSYNTGDSTTPTAPGITTTTPNAMIIAAYGHEHGSGTIVSPPSGMTTAATAGIDVTIGASFGVAYSLKASAGSTTDFTFTVGDEDTWGAIAFAFMDENESPPPVTASGALQATTADMVGTGQGYTVIIGSGAVEAVRAVGGGTGDNDTSINISGALQASAADVDGTAAVIRFASGSLSAGGVVMEAVAERKVTGAGAIATGNASTAASVERIIPGAGTIAAAVSTIHGDGLRAGDSQGQMVAAPTSLAASVQFARNAAGALAAGGAATDNTSKISWMVVGGIAAGPAIAASGVSVFRGQTATGSPQARAAGVNAATKRTVSAAGALTAEPSEVYLVSWLETDPSDSAWTDYEGGQWVAKN